MAAINPYLTFKNNCEEAFEFYRSVFGGEFHGPGIMRMGDMDTGQPVPEDAKNLVMHVTLPIGEGTVLMGSDAPDGFGPPLNVGNNISIAIKTDSAEEADRLFAGLSDGGNVTMPIADAFWGAYFGMFTDKFGINWMVNYDRPQG
jgi:PhnB protein